MAESDSNLAAKLLEKISIQTKSRSWDQKLSEFSHVEELFASSPQVQRQALLHLVEAISQRSYGQTDVDLIDRLLKRKLPLIEDDLLALLSLALHQDWAQAYSIKALERYSEQATLSAALRSAVDRLRDPIRDGGRSSSDQQKLLRRTAALLGEEVEQKIELDEVEPWARLLLNNLHQLAGSNAAVMRQLVVHASVASGSKPSAKWLKEAAAITEKIDEQLTQACLTVWIAAFGEPRASALADYYISSVWLVSETNADMMKGLIWLASLYADEELIRAISAAGLSGQKKIPGLGPRSAKVSNAAVWALSQIDNPLAIGQLAILRSKITNKSTQKVIDKAIQAVAERLKVPADEIEEMAVPTYGLTDIGKRTEQLGEFTAELVVTGTNSTELRWFKPDGKSQKSIPKAVKENYGDDLKELKTAANDIKKILPAQRNRIDQFHLKQKTWSYPIWAERYLNHPLVGTLARRLIWVFEEEISGDNFEATWCDGQLVDAIGNALEFDRAKAIVSLWHAIDHKQEAIVAWRRSFEERQIQQPFKQAHREIYLLTDAERNTNTYSNRYASHVIKQHQFKALCQARGWRYDLMGQWDSQNIPERELPEFGIRAEFWVEAAGEDQVSESGIFLYLATDQVRFYRYDPEIYARDRWEANAGGELLSLENVPPLVFSEIMRDVDLFVGVASVGNDPQWQDGGPEGRHRDYWHYYSFGDLSATAQTRREILERLVPRLKIAERCSFDDKFLIVRGDKRTYKIHLGSSNILMEPNDQYLCIVPGRGAGPGDKIFLPFEGDQRLAVILSKAMMLSDDTKIKDQTILSQIEIS